MSKFALPTEVTSAVTQASKDESGIQLPFAAPLMYWINGKVALKNEAEIKDARRFGGWGIDEAKLAEMNVTPAPSWKLTEMANNKGDNYKAFICRTAWVAPIARRTAWFEIDGKSRSSLNVLAYLFLRNQEGKYLEFGPVVLSAKSYTAMELESQIKRFATMTAENREGTPAQFFLHGLGTFGDTPIYKEAKSKSGASSTTTPPQLAIPTNGFTPEKMVELFVGAEVASKMADYAKQAQPWLDDWNKKNVKPAAESEPVRERPSVDEEDPFI